MSKKEDVNYITKEIVAKNIAVLRDILGLSQEKFAERVQLPVERIRQMEGGPGALDNCVDLLCIAQSCNVHYLDLFESESESDGYTKCNAHVPKYVMDVIDAKRTKEHLTKRELCDKIGTHWTMWAKWMRGISNPSPMAFNNLIAVLGLRSFDFTNAKPKEEETDVELCENAEVAPADDFEARILKAVRLQKKIEEYLGKMDEIVEKITNLRNELASEIRGK